MMSLMSGPAASQLVQAIDLMSILELARDAEKHKAALQELADARKAAIDAESAAAATITAASAAKKSSEEAAAAAAAGRAHAETISRELEELGLALTKREEDIQRREADVADRGRSLEAGIEAACEKAASIIKDAEAVASGKLRAAEFELAAAREKVIRAEAEAAGIISAANEKLAQAEAAAVEAEAIRGKLRQAQALISG